MAAKNKNSRAQKAGSERARKASRAKESPPSAKTRLKR